MRWEEFLEKRGVRFEWPYRVSYGEQKELSADVLVLGGGAAGLHAAINAAKRGAKVVLVDKGPTLHSGSIGAGVDHWHYAVTNPCCKISPEEFAQALIDNHGGYNCGIYRYIQCRESYDTLLELEKMGAKIRDTEGEFSGAEFRDEKTKLLFAYDYENRYTIRIWGTTFKRALYNECKRLGVEMYEWTMATSLLTEGGNQGSKVVGATGFNVRTGEFYVFTAKAIILCMASPERVWAFSTEHQGLFTSGVTPPNLSGDGFAMAWEAGAEFGLMEKSNRIGWGGAVGFSVVPYATGNARNTWYPCTMVDSTGKEFPWVDRDGRILQTISERTRPAPGQKFFLLGGGSRSYFVQVYEWQPPRPAWEMKGFVPPFYADLGSLSEHERRAIFGLMVGQEGKTWIVYHNLTRAGFDPDKDLLQVYQPGRAPSGWRQMGFNSGGLVFDWDLKTNIEGLYAAGNQLMSAIGDCSAACTTGKYAGRKAAEYAKKATEPMIDRKQVEDAKARVYAPTRRKNGIEWKELASGIARVMQEYCGDARSDERLKIGLKWLSELREGEASTLYARNPHELMRAQEVMIILTVAEMIMHASLAHKASSKWLDFYRSDYPEVDPPEWHKWITIRQEKEEVKVGELPIDYWGPLKENYEAHCGL